MAAGLLVGAGCNPYSDHLPRPVCQGARHCLPGETCEEGRCTAEGKLKLTVVAPSGRSVRVALLAAPMGSPAVTDSRYVREVAERAPVPVHGGRAEVVFEDLPLLPLWTLIWRGDAERPCRGTPATLSPVPFGRASDLTLVLTGAWGQGCFELPGPLGYEDHMVFDRGVPIGRVGRPLAGGWP